MAGKRKIHAKTAPPRKTHRKIKKEISPAEIVASEAQARHFKNCELSWLKMTAPPAEEDRWGAVEEHLLAKPSEREHSMRRWKYFSK